MKAISENPCYDELVDSLGFTIVASKQVGDYQGTHFYLLKDEERFGYLLVGYGSCSGCDSLEACEGDINEITKLRDGFLTDIKWYDEPHKLVEELVAKDPDWYYETAKVNELFFSQLPVLPFTWDVLSCILGDAPKEILADALSEAGLEELAVAVRGSEDAKIRLHDYVLRFATTK